MTIEQDKIKVLIVDDSPFMRKMVTDMLEGDPRIKVIGTASNGEMAILKVKELNPDAITLDVEMPVMDGLATLKALKNIRQLPVIMFSSHTKKGAEVTINALELGAFDFVQKPDETQGINAEQVKAELIEKIIAAFNNHKRQPELVFAHPSQPAQNSLIKRDFLRKTSGKANEKLVVIGSSTGGPQALKTVLTGLPKDFPAKMLLVQHMPPKFTETFAKRLDSLCEISVVEAQHGNILEPGKAFLAPGNFHMMLESSTRISLNQEPQICGLRPAADVTFISAAQFYNTNMICVILTGMGHDGTAGIKVAREKGAYCIAEHESTCVVYGMPRSVINAGQADSVAPLHNISEEIMRVLYE